MTLVKILMGILVIAMGSMMFFFDGYVYSKHPERFFDYKKTMETVRLVLVVAIIAAIIIHFTQTK